MRVLSPVLVLICANAWAQTFEVTLGDPATDEGGHCLAQGPNGDLYVGGHKEDSAMVMRLNANGNVLWSRAFKPSPDFPCFAMYMTLAPNGDLVGTGNGVGPGPAYFWHGFHFRMDPNGNMLWCKMWDHGGTAAYTARIIPTSQAQWLVAGGIYYTGGPTFADVFTGWVDPATGEVTQLNDRVDQFSSNPYIDDMVDIAPADSGYYATSRISIDGASQAGFRTYIARYDAAGVHQWTRALLHTVNESARTYGESIVAHDDSLTVLYTGNVNGSSAVYTVGLVRMDLQGNVIWARNYDILGSSHEVGSYVGVMGDGYLIAGRHAALGNNLFLMHVSFNGAVNWCRSYGGANTPEEHSTLRASPVLIGPDGVWMVGQRTTGDEDVYLLRADTLGQVACAPPTDFNVSTTILNNFSQPTGRVLNADAAIWTDAVAAPTPMPGACALEPWLGNDTLVCGPLLLDATTPGAVYQWSDGSTGPTVLAADSGTYWVQVTVGCCTATDTVLVQEGLSPVASFMWVQDTNNPTAVFLISTSTGADEVTWLLPDTTLQGDSTYFDYGVFGHHMACIVATNGCGSDTLCAPVDVFPTGVAQNSSSVMSMMVLTVPDGLQCVLPSSGPWTITVHDASGRLITDRTASGTRCTIPLPEASGALLLTARHTSGEVSTARVVVGLR